MSAPRVPSSFWESEPSRQLHLALAALDNAHDTLLIHDLQGRLVYFNATAAQALGYTPEEFDGLRPWGFAAGEKQEAIDARVEVILREGSMRFLSTRIAADGTPRVYEVESRPLYVEGGPYLISASQDVSERVEAQEALRRLAFHDSLTGLANRALFDDRLEQALVGARRHGWTVGVVYLDVDDFKNVNDTHGHGVGDAVLVALAERLSEGVRAEDTVARLGGDEFVVLLPKLASPADLRSVSRLLCERAAEPVEVDGALVSVTVSEGIALFDPRCDDARSMIMRADIQMYEAKRARLRTR
jgi:diguanylate cyclase (GGDEF)-like protein/PAS domain S-box-containing protein